MKVIKIDTNIRLIRHWGRWYVAYAPYSRDYWGTLRNIKKAKGRNNG